MTTLAQLLGRAAVDAIAESHAEWIALHALPALRAVCTRGGVRGTLTSEDVWAELAARKAPTPPDPRAMGAVVRQAHRQGIIAPTGRFTQGTRPEAHGRPVAVWDIVQTLEGS